MLREQLAVHVGDLAHEDGAHVLARDGELEPLRAREARRAASSTRARDERVGGVRPGDADLELLERLERAPLERRRERLAASRVQPSTDRAIGPAWSKLGASGKQPSSGTRP